MSKRAESKRRYEEHVDYVSIAIQLGYSDSVIESLMSAENDYERDQIMASARRSNNRKIIWNEWEDIL